MDKKIKFMKKALSMAKKALDIDEVPIGCVIVKDDKIIAKGYNLRENKKMTFGHAEIMAIKSANKKLQSWRLEDCDIYITLEPCIMCAGAIIQARIKNVYFGASDPKGGAFGSSLDVLTSKKLNHYPHVEGGILMEECSSIITNYFKEKRNKK